MTVSLAGRVARPALPGGEVRIGGFGGVDGLAAWLRDNEIDAVVDATHPFARRMTAHAARPAPRIGVPLLRAAAAGLDAAAGDDWRLRRRPAAAAAAADLRLGERVFLTTGRQGLAAFAALDALVPRPLGRAARTAAARADARCCSTAARSRWTASALLARAPHRRAGDQGQRRPDDAAKLAAARERGVPVVIVGRPPLPPGVITVPTVAAAVSWLGHAAGREHDGRRCRA